MFLQRVADLFSDSRTSLVFTTQSGLIRTTRNTSLPNLKRERSITASRICSIPRGLTNKDDVSLVHHTQINSLFVYLRVSCFSEFKEAYLHFLKSRLVTRVSWTATTRSPRQTILLVHVCTQRSSKDEPGGFQWETNNIKLPV